ncbi:MAG: hypothetical protein AAF716_04125 [Cyanobacteria bacterium P01_D01_bin.1]
MSCRFIWSMPKMGDPFAKCSSMAAWSLMTVKFLRSTKSIILAEFCEGLPAYRQLRKNFQQQRA